MESVRKNLTKRTQDTFAENGLETLIFQGTGHVKAVCFPPPFAADEIGQTTDLAAPHLESATGLERA